MHLNQLFLHNDIHVQQFHPYHVTYQTYAVVHFQQIHRNYLSFDLHIVHAMSLKQNLTFLFVEN